VRQWRTSSGVSASDTLRTRRIPPWRSTRTRPRVVVTIGSGPMISSLVAVCVAATISKAAAEPGDVSSGRFPMPGRRGFVRREAVRGRGAGNPRGPGRPRVLRCRQSTGFMPRSVMA
jgi:hypothetical protein